MLLANGYIRVDGAAASGGLGYDSTAAQYLTQNAGGLFTKDQYYNNPFMFGNADGSATPEQLAMPGGTAHPVAGMVIGGAITGGLALGPEAVAGIGAAAKACAANPVLCANPPVSDYLSCRLNLRRGVIFRHIGATGLPA
ncbi:hypothetical protein CIW54_28170 [Paraburkholderia sp. T12-10]|nr:hypothetical protein CIW54_28170 [Paraburkholderia sp. T12-10]